MTPRGIVTLVFDDGYQHILQNVIPLLDHYKIPAVFAIPLEKNILQQESDHQLADLTTWQQALHNSPHELAAHSVTHRDLTTVTATELEHELQTPAQALPATTLIYPGGAQNDTVIAATKKYYSAARTVQKGFNHIPAKNPLQLKTYDFTRHNFSVTKANLLALYAFLTNSWLIETYHIVSDQDTTNTHVVSQKGLEKHLQILQNLPVSTKTINQVL